MSQAPESEAFDRFLERVWQSDIQPLLRGRYKEQRAKTARFGSKWAGAAGALFDKALRLRGRPFSRAMTVLGGSFGAILPDVWEWRWFESLTSADRQTVADRIRARAAALDDAHALGLFGLTTDATRAQVQAAWRAAARRWHPDLARSEAERDGHHLRFVTYQQAYERLESAYDEGRLPRTSGERADSEQAAPET